MAVVLLQSLQRIFVGTRPIASLGLRSIAWPQPMCPFPTNTDTLVVAAARPRSLVIAVFDGVKLLDVAAAAEVFAEANPFDADYQRKVAAGRRRRVPDTAKRDREVRGKHEIRAREAIRESTACVVYNRTQMRLHSTAGSRAESVPVSLR
jgi:hypothetical protein